MKALLIKSRRFRHLIVLPAVLLVALYQLSAELKSLCDLKSSAFLAPNQNTFRIYREITYTNFGWLQPDAEKGLEVGRSWHAKHFMDAVLGHDRYNESAWRDLQENPDPSRPILAFLDIDSCLELHYPRFGQDWKMASDLEGGRKSIQHWNISYPQVCPIIDKALESPAMSAPESRLVVFNCESFGPAFANCTGGDRDEDKYSKLVVAHLTAHKSQVHRHDFGIPPMPVKSVQLNETQLDDIRNCRATQTRSHLFSFTGRARNKFKAYKMYWAPKHGKNGVHAVFTTNHYKQKNTTNAWGGKVLEALPPENQTQDHYNNLLMDSVFVGAPRGDNLYSVRFSEIMSAAAIPIVHANGWVLPFTKDVVDWSELVVLLPEAKVSQSLQVMRSMSEQEICQRQQRILAFYKEYIADFSGTLRAILKIMDARIDRESHEITNFTAAPDTRRRL